MTTALAEQPTSMGTVGNQESSKGSRGFLRKQSPEAQARAERFKEVKDALGVARTAFATEVRSATQKTKDSEFATFSTYESALNDYLTYLMHSQGFAMAEMARIGERDTMGALWRAKNKVKFWGGTAALAVGTGVLRTGVGIAAGVVLNKLIYTPISKAVTNTLTDYSTESIMAKRQKEAREASNNGVDFKTFTGSENLLEKNLSSRFKKVSSYLRKERLARLLLSVGSGTGIALLTGGGISSHILHDHMGTESIGDVMSEHIGDKLSRFFTEGITPQIGAALGAVGTFFFGSQAMAAELPVTSGGTNVPVAPSEVSSSVVRPVSGIGSGTSSSESFSSSSANSGEFNMQDQIEGRRYFVSPTDTGEGGVPRVESQPDVVSRLGSAPFALSRVEAFNDAHIQSAADGAVRGGMRPEFRDEFVAALRAQRGVTNPEMIQIGPRQSGEWMLGRNGSVLGVGEKDFLLDTTRTAVPGSQTAIVVYPAERFSFTAEDSDGVLHRITILRADECNNFMQVGDEIISRPPPVVPPPAEVIPPPPTEIPPARPPTEVFLKRDPIVTVCHEGGGSCDVPTNAYMIFDERGMSLPDAQERVRDLILGEDRRGTESILIPGYQSNIPAESRFVLMHYTDPATGRTSYWCMNIANNPDGDRAGHFSHPTISTSHGRSIEVRTEAQWQALVNGPGNVVDPSDPIIPLVLRDTNNNGIPDVVGIRPEDVPTRGPARARQ